MQQRMDTTLDATKDEQVGQLDLPLFLSNGQNWPDFHVAQSFIGPDQNYTISDGPYSKLAHGNILSKIVTFRLKL